MNTSSPTPPRRRRPPQEFLSEEAPVRRYEVRQEIPARSGPAQKHPHKPKKRTSAHIDRAFEDSIFERIPTPLRVLLITVCAAIFLTCTVGITRDYLARQEERRRLEAEAAERAQHPLRYADQIMYYSLMQNLDPALVSAVILCESSFNPQAESRVGARGLMQLMEDTAGWARWPTSRWSALPESGC